MPSKRYIISHRLADKIGKDAQQNAAETFQASFDASLADNVDLQTDTGATERKRRKVYAFEADSDEVAAKTRDLGADAIIEEVMERVPAVSVPAQVARLRANASLAMSPPGKGDTFKLTVHIGGRPTEGVKVTLYLLLLQTGQATEIVGRTDASGQVEAAYDSTVYRITLAWIEPRANAWSMVVDNPQSGVVVECPVLPFEGPLGWWSKLVGDVVYSQGQGQGMRVGVIDTGCGPNANLAQVQGVGAFIDGNHDPNPEATLDARDHGTHVCGIIGARPQADSGQYAGIAPGVDLYCARVFTKTHNANQGDIAAAIDYLSIESKVDLINLSLGGTASQIEHDAILVAFSEGVLCLCAAGNGHGAPVSHPAAYSATAAISALGLLNTYPHGASGSTYLPSTRDKYSSQYPGLFLADFSNIGPQITVTAPGNAIISTVPSSDGGADYLAMDGTSMATPAATAVLADLLASDPGYRRTTNTAKANYAFAKLMQHARGLGLSPFYQGHGLAYNH